MDTNIAQLFTCKGDKIANAGYLENKEDFFVTPITCTTCKLSGSV